MENITLVQIKNGQRAKNGSLTSLCNEEVETNVDFQLFKSNDHNSYTERNDECKVGAENFPSAEERKQNDETRSHSGKLCSVI